MPVPEPFPDNSIFLSAAVRLAGRAVFEIATVGKPVYY
jgi:hypothetical protein